MYGLTFLAAKILGKLDANPNIEADKLNKILPELEVSTCKEILVAYTSTDNKKKQAEQLENILYTILPRLTEHLYYAMSTQINCRNKINKQLVKSWCLDIEVSTKLATEFDKYLTNTNCSDKDRETLLKLFSGILQIALNKTYTCSECSSKVSGKPFFVFDKDTTVCMCSECASKKIKYTCIHCNNSFTSNNSNQTKDGLVCPDCIKIYYKKCEYCGVYEKNGLVKSRKVNVDLGNDAVNKLICDTCVKLKFTSCYSCGCLIENGREVTTDGGRLCPRCDVRKRLYGSRTGLTTKVVKLGNTYTECKSKRIFGVEIETNILTRDNNTDWSKVNDASIAAREFVSPKLNGDLGFADIKKFLSEIDATVDKVIVREMDKVCGLHVHVDGSDLTIEDIIKLYRAACPLQDLFFYLVKPERSSCRHCVLLSDRYAKLKDIHGVEMILYGHGGEDAARRKKEKYSGERYNWLNVHSWFYRGSIEMRQHHGTLDYDEIVNWISLMTCFVDWVKTTSIEAIDEATLSITSANSLKNRLSKFLELVAKFSNKDVANFYAAQIKKFYDIVVPSYNVQHIKVEVEKEPVEIEDIDEEEDGYDNDDNNN